jgi:DNA-binding winged helix-turn-helix (wHTH) protein
MSTPSNGPALAHEADFHVGALRVSPSACRVYAGTTELRVEAQTMAVLIVLARANGATVSRDALVEACWQGRAVSDDAITRTIAKVRALAKGLESPPFTLETLPKVGYRLVASDTKPELPATTPAAGKARRWQPVAVLAGLAIAIPLAWASLPRLLGPGPAQADTAAAALPAAGEVAEALILLDLPRVQAYLDRGWNPNWKLDSEGGASLHTLFIACERNPTHDRGMVARIARMLVVSGADPLARNKWDDSPLDIASSPRYCGPNHPVVDFLRSMTPDAGSAG